MSERTATIASSQGLHARPASLFVKTVAESGAKVTIAKGDKSVNAASILGVISLGVSKGDEVTLVSDSDAVLDELVGFLETDHDA